jgi:hypothetical protein
VCFQGYEFQLSYKYRFFPYKREGKTKKGTIRVLFGKQGNFEKAL